MSDNYISLLAALRESQIGAAALWEGIVFGDLVSINRKGATYVLRSSFEHFCVVRMNKHSIDAGAVEFGDESSSCGETSVQQNTTHFTDDNAYQGKISLNMGGARYE